jgi:hypothetical protein
MKYEKLFKTVLLEAINGPDQADSLSSGNKYRAGTEEFKNSLDKETDPASFDVQGNPKVEEAMNEFEHKMGVLDSLETADKNTIEQKLNDLQAYIVQVQAYLDAKGQPIDLNRNPSIVANEIRKDPTKLNEFKSVSGLIEKYRDAVKKEEATVKAAGEEVKGSLDQLRKARNPSQELPGPIALGESHKKKA